MTTPMPPSPMDLLTPEIIDLARTAPVMADDDPRLEILIQDPDAIDDTRWATFTGDNFYITVNAIIGSQDDPDSVAEGHRIHLDRFMQWEGAAAFIADNQELLDRYRRVLPAVRTFFALQDWGMEAYNDAGQRYRAGDGAAFDRVEAARVELDRIIPHQLGMLAVNIAVCDQVNPIYEELIWRMYVAGMPGRADAMYTGAWPPPRPSQR